MANSYKRKGGIPLPEQIFRMKRLFPDFVYSYVKGRIIWEGDIQPTSLSAKYKVRVQYAVNDSPKVWVLSPQLIERDGVSIPHTFPGKRLCLYLPGAGEWSREMHVAETIIPWTSLWLYHYELWHATGKWHGGGVHPASKKQ
jgi:hypothetical protein